VSLLLRFLPQSLLALALTAVVGWPVIATVAESWRAFTRQADTLPGAGTAIDVAGSSAILGDSGEIARPLRLALETLGLVTATEALVLPLGVLLAVLLFRTDIVGRRLVLGLIALTAFVPLPLHATAWLGAFGNMGRAQVFGIRPILVGRLGAVVVHALAALPWVVLIVGAGLCAVEPELEESALLEYPALRVLVRVTLRRALGAIVAAALAVAVLTAGDMTVTDLLSIRTYAEESFLQYSLGRGPGEAALVAVPPIAVLGTLVVLMGRALARLDPSRLVSSFARARLWHLGRWRIPGGLLLIVLVGNAIALPIYSLVWRAGRVGGRAAMGKPPTWSLSGLENTLRFAFDDIWDPLKASLLWTAVAATLTVALAGAVAWSTRRSILWRLITLLILAITLAAPGPVAGMSFILAYRSIPQIYDSPAMIVMAQTMRALPFALLLLWPFLRAFPQDYLDAAALDGASPGRRMTSVVIPLSVRAIVVAWAIAYAFGLGELPATNLVSPPGTQPMSVLIWALLHTGVESHLAGVALIMLSVIAIAGVIAVIAVRSLRAIGPA
jgi:iron(III) transport system permease protein